MLDDRVTTLVLTNQSTLIGKTKSSDSALTVTALQQKYLSKVQSESNYGNNTTYMAINIVDRAQQLQTL